jgi:NAD(P)-dependent dehydrogenase (short-subunit alcohol dehydrogenase family)
MNEKKVLLLTGCTGIFGSKFVELYSDKYLMVGVSRTPPASAERTFDYFQADLAQDHKGVVDYVLDRYGRLDVLVNNAASKDIDASLKPVRHTSFADQIHLNTVVPFELIRYVFSRFWIQAGPLENQRHNRNVINMGSILSARHVRLSGAYEGHYSYACYSATKRALSALTKNLSYELEPYGVRINLLAPSSFPSEQPTELVCRTCAEIENSDHNGTVTTIDYGEVKTLRCECELAGGRPLELVFRPDSEGEPVWT